MELLPVIALFLIAGVTWIADTVGQHALVASLVAGGGWLALLYAEFRPRPRARRTEESRRMLVTAATKPPRVCFEKGSG